MDELVQLLEALTDQLISEIEHVDYQAMERFVERRESIIAGIRAVEGQQPIQDKHKESIKRVMQYDPIITRKIAFFCNEARLKMQGIQQANTQRNVYDAAYGSDSLFFDKRK
ncbi:hypothetical protein FPZ49_14255 [Paenibacillus cremeus]|uniref:Flagellar protein FliT n=2 Tax=Paenibacillus cremeus TaxID=2163881 RepID=A0A559KB36_9BACL|nr:hypothetical protein FPZ49_14255 [Paenibacillus cremeus]